MPEDTNSAGWNTLGDAAPLSQKLGYLLQSLRARGAAVDRLAVVIYDHPSDTLKTFLSVGDDPPTLSNYQARLADVPSLQELVARRQVRVIGDLQVREPRRAFAAAAGRRIPFELHPADDS